MIIFSVYDKKAEYFLQPMFARNAAQMLRDLSDVVSNRDSLLGKHPEDYAVYQLAQFDEISGAIFECNRVKLGDCDSLFRPQLRSDQVGDHNG